MATSPPTIAALPATPDPTSPSATFDAAAYAWSVALPAFVTSTNAVGTNVYDNAVDAADKATTATTQAGIATDQADIAIAQAVIATTKAGDATSQAASVLAMDKRYLGSFAVAPGVDNQGAALQPGAVFYDSALNKVRTWSGSAWIEGITSVAGVASVNGATGAVVIPQPYGRFLFFAGA